jgi:hypothetical protein
MLVVVALATFADFSFALPVPRSVQDYIARFQKIAQVESAHSGIPTSIILAQAIAESQFGTSELAIKANNHFGVKWKPEFDSPYILVYDDDKDRRGKLIPSKFVKYSSAEESFRHHSEVLKKDRYAKLFKYDIMDYRSWAKGLSECGYATDSEYAQKLINIIEKYDLARFDIPEVLAFEEIDEDDLSLFEITNTKNITPTKEAPKPKEKPTQPAKVEPTNSTEFYEILPAKGIKDNPTPLPKKAAGSRRGN